METSAQDLWLQALSIIRDKINTQSFETWLKPTKALSLTDDSLQIEVSKPFLVDFLAEHYLPLMETAIEAVAKKPLKVLLSYQEQKGTSSSRKRKFPIISPGASALLHESQLHERYTFEAFVVGKGNEFAHAAALAVAEAPSKVYNPLFIYGGAGLGKTHLTQAIGHFVKKERSKYKVYYTPAENFMNEMIFSIQHRKTIEFKKKYREMDILLLDDVQFLANKESLQEEIFHTFNSLYDAHRQIVITSDRPPKEIPNLEERLVSRFQSGLVADIQPPDLETRIAILKKKAELEGSVLPNDVLFFIAERVRSNIRELEGCLIRLLAFSSLSGSEITLELTQEILKDILPSQEKRVNIDQIKKCVATYFNLPEQAMSSKRRTKEFAFPRQIAMYLSRELTNYSTNEIGSKFGGKDHTTVIYAHERIAKLAKDDLQFRVSLEKIISNLKREFPGDKLGKSF